MDKTSYKDFQKSDKTLNSIYQQILKEYKSDTAFIRNFKVAQKIGIQLRDAEMNTKYPDRPEGYYGSVQPMCWNMYLKELTDERIIKIKVWLKGIKEGDVCAGSVKII